MEIMEYQELANYITDQLEYRKKLGIAPISHEDQDIKRIEEKQHLWSGN